MIERKYIQANGLRQHFRQRKGRERLALFIHGNGSDSVFWEKVMAAMPSEFTCLAPDLRGYGYTESKPADASRSFGDFVDDLKALLDTFKAKSYTVFGHSLGGGIAWELWLADSDRIDDMIMVNPASPFGFGGTRNLQGDLTYPDGAGSGAGVINPEFVKLLKQKERGVVNPSSPRNVMNSFYWEPPFVPIEMDDLLEGLLRMEVGQSFYPGDSKDSPNFPFTKPGSKGQINAASPLSKTEILSQLQSIAKPLRCAWVRGAKDKIVSDESLFDTAVLGKMGLKPNYPGADVCPPQPMVSQTRFVLEEIGADFEEIVFEDCGHSPYIEDFERFMDLIRKRLGETN